MSSRKRPNGEFLRECRQISIKRICGDMDAQLASPRFAERHPAVAEEFKRYIDQARVHLAGDGRTWKEAKEQGWLRQAGAAWRIFTSKYNPD